ncbi:MAG: hypothetical protein QOI89_1114 [Solirubrobacteraceae bacterium]|jgi:hypothetical protein|nr:hypothetical protein [Solirubrobacteraceae bacterium]MEA2672884.1 hypothetical protein [Chloroflexota bacterium]
MSKKLLVSLAPLAAVVAFSVAPGAASAAECRILTQGVGVPAPPCNNPPGNVAPQNLRDDVTDAPNGFGTDALAVNTVGKLRFKASPAGVAILNENPKGYAFFGLKLDKNPVAANGAEATGWVPFVDVQKANPSPVFSGDKPATPWTFKIRSDLSTENPGRVLIENISLLFESAGVTAAGTFQGVYEQPGANCPAGGVKLTVLQPLITTAPASTTTPELDNGEAGKNAFICFVSANNYLFPEKEPVWAPLTGKIWKK